MARGSLTWIRRLSFAAILLVVAVAPGPAAGSRSGACKRVLWTSGPLPWPHYFVDPSGVGGSTSPSSDGLLLAICAELGPSPRPGAVQSCLRPELAAVNR